MMQGEFSVYFDLFIYLTYYYIKFLKKMCILPPTQAIINHK